MIEIDYINYSKLNRLLGYSIGILMAIALRDIPDDVKNMIGSEIKKIQEAAQKITNEVLCGKEE